jgi:redox-sensitive bicupin YhaK (pirin superfamily)
MDRRTFNKTALALTAGAAITPLAEAVPTKLDILRAADRGVADHGWLSSRHSFSFADYYNPEQMGFSDLLVINEDRVSAGRGFPRHPHRDMEIFSYVLEGQLEHRDSMGNGSVISEGDVQIMSAGRGVFHSEFNPNPAKPVHFLQIWLTPDQRGYDPTYQQTRVTPEEKRGKLKLLFSPDKAQGSLQIRQDARVYAGLFDGKEQTTLKLPANRHAYVHVARGSLEVNGQQLGAGDGARARTVPSLHFAKGHGAEVLVFDMRPIETPRG